MTATDGVNPIHSLSDPASHWSTTNTGEAMPGVLTPLGWSVWGPSGERATRQAFYLIGALVKAETEEPVRAEERFLNIFYGRAAARVDFLARIGDVMPGTSGAAVATQLLGYVPPDLASRPTRSRWPAVAARFPVTFARMPRATIAARKDTEPWWRRELARTPQLGLAEARQQFAAARDRFERNLTLQTITVVACIQPVYDQLSRLATKAGMDGAALMSGQGAHDETATVEDLWLVSRGELDLDAFLERHGYHGPFEGEISGRVWRENPDPLRQLVDGYRGMAGNADPRGAEVLRAEQRRRAEAELLAALPRSRQAQARLVLRLAAQRLPLRGVGKTAFLQALDVLRASARHIGALLADEGALADPEDVFQLTVPEIVAAAGHPAADVIVERKERHREYQDLRVPDVFQGLPEPIPVAVDRLSEPASDHITGTGASPGMVEARVVVVTDPSTTDFEPGDILVAHTTDPSWASIMFLASALVVDIGGLLSHAAVVARELGVPCVMGTGSGTRDLRTGDVCRVDGAAGTIQVLKRAE